MAKKPTTLPSYIEFVSRLAECNKILDNLIDRKNGLDEIKKVLTNFRPKDEGYQSLPIQNRIDQLTIDIELTQSVLLKAQEETLKERQDHVDDLEKRLFEEQEKVKLLIEDVSTNEKLMRADTASKDALDTANKIRKKYDESVKKLNQYTNYQEILGIQKVEINEIQAFEYTYDIRQTIWSIRQFFSD